MDVHSSAAANSGPVIAGLSPLSRTLRCDMAADVDLGGDVSARLTWNDLTVTATDSTVRPRRSSRT